MKFDQSKFSVPRPVSEEDVKKIFSMDAYYANKFYIAPQADGMVRICFADVDPSDTIMTPRFVVAVPFAAFMAFAQLVGNNAKTIEAMQKAANDTAKSEQNQ